MEGMLEAYNKLEAAIRPRTLEECDKRDPLVVLCFNEINPMTRKGKDATRTSLNTYPTPYAVMHSAIARLDGQSCFTLFISTYTPPYTLGPPQKTPSSGMPTACRIIQAHSQKHPSTAIRPSQLPHLTIHWLKRLGLDSW